MVAVDVHVVHAASLVSVTGAEDHHLDAKRIANLT